MNLYTLIAISVVCILIAFIFYLREKNPYTEEIITKYDVNDEEGYFKYERLTLRRTYKNGKIKIIHRKI